MWVLYSTSMNAQHRPTRSYRPSTLSYLFLATFWSMNCLASNTFEQDGLYTGLLSSDTRSSMDTSVKDSHPFNLVTRQSNESVQLADNSIVPKEIFPGTTDFWTFSPSLQNVSASSTLYITVSACTQPFPKIGLNATQIYTNETLPPLQLYISIDPSNPRPDPSSSSLPQTSQNFSLGFTSFNITPITKDVFLSVAAQNTTSNWEGSWSYQLATSTKGTIGHPYTELTTEPLQRVIDGTSLYLIDTSQTEALITTGNLTTSQTQPFEIYTVL